MKYLFIVNPAAGQSNPMKKYGEQFARICKAKGIDYEIVLTEHAGHATELAKNAALSADAENPVRIFAVGGDGTLCEVANGLMHVEHCELGCIPCGSGNDFVKAFGRREEFLDLEQYITAPSVPIDAIKTEHMDSINLCSLGLDANICAKANEIKGKNKKYSNSSAYNRALVRCVLGRLYNDIKITVDDKEVFEGKYLFALAASGQYYGGGYHSAPMADPSDGLLDFIFVKTVSHLRVPFLVGDYKSGKIMEKRKFRKIAKHIRGRKMRVEAKQPAIVNFDGNCLTVKDVTFEVDPSALRFIVPPAYAAKKGVSAPKEAVAAAQ